HAGRVRRCRWRDTAAYASASVRAERGHQRRCSAGGEPHLDSFVAGTRLCGAGRLHVRGRAAGAVRRHPAQGVQAATDRRPGVAARKRRMSSPKWLAETAFGGARISFEVTCVLHHEKTTQHELDLIENPLFGKVLMLDGAT